MKKPKEHKWRKKLLVFLFILLNVGVILWTALSEFSDSENAERLSNIEIKWYLLIPACILFTIAIISEVYRYILMMQKTCHKTDWKLARRTILIGRYYDNITPAAIGGQPFQIYYMNKGGMPSGYSTVIPIIGMVSGQIGFIVVAIISFLFGSFTVNNAALVAAGTFGLLFYAFWPIAIIVATFLPKTTAEFITLGVKLLSRLHIIKDRNAAIKKAEKGVNEYARCVRTILRTKGLFFKTIVLGIFYHLLICSIPFFVISAFGGGIDFVPCFVTTVAVTSAVYFIPTPGNAGAAEGTFFIVFSALSSGYVFWAMLVWRFFSYYIYIIMGLIVYARMYLEKNGQNNIFSEWSKKVSDFFIWLFGIEKNTKTDKKDN